MVDKKISIKPEERKVIAYAEAENRIAMMSDDELIAQAALADEYHGVCSLEEHLQDQAKDELVDQAKDTLKEIYANEILEELSDPVKYFVDDNQRFSLDELKDQSFIVLEPNRPNPDDIIAKYQGNIKTENDIRGFFQSLYDMDIAFHPDDGFEDYIDSETKHPLFTPNQAEALDNIMIECIELSDPLKIDIYEIAMEMFNEEMEKRGMFFYAVTDTEGDEQDELARGGLVGFVNKNAENIVKHYLPIHEPNEVSQSSELRKEGDYLIDNDTSGDGSKVTFITVFFGTEFPVAEKSLDDHYDGYAEFLQKIADKENYNVDILSADDKTVTFRFSNPRTATRGRYAKGGDLSKQVLNVDYAGGKFETWFYSEGERHKGITTHDYEEVLRYKRKNDFTDIVLTDEARQHNRSKYGDCGSVKKMPEKGTPEWHQIQIAKKTMSYNDVGALMMGGMSKEIAVKILNQYGITTDSKGEKFNTGGMVNHGFRAGDEIIEIYQGYGIIEWNHNGVIEVINPEEGTRFIVDLDDSKMSGNRTSSGMEYEEQIKAAKKYIDYINKVHPLKLEINDDYPEGKGPNMRIKDYPKKEKGGNLEFGSEAYRRIIKKNDERKQNYFSSGKAKKDFERWENDLKKQTNAKELNKVWERIADEDKYWDLPANWQNDLANIVDEREQEFTATKEYTSADLPKNGSAINIHMPALGNWPARDVVLKYDQKNFAFDIYQDGKKVGQTGERQVLQNLENGFYELPDKKAIGGTTEGNDKYFGEGGWMKEGELTLVNYKTSKNSKKSYEGFIEIVWSENMVIPVIMKYRLLDKGKKLVKELSVNEAEKYLHEEKIWRRQDLGKRAKENAPLDIDAAMKQFNDFSDEQIKNSKKIITKLKGKLSNVYTSFDSGGGFAHVAFKMKDGHWMTFHNADSDITISKKTYDTSEEFYEAFWEDYENAMPYTTVSEDDDFSDVDGLVKQIEEGKLVNAYDENDKQNFAKGGTVKNEDLLRDYRGQQYSDLEKYPLPSVLGGFLQKDTNPYGFYGKVSNERHKIGEVRYISPDKRYSLTIREMKSENGVPEFGITAWKNQTPEEARESFNMGSSGNLINTGSGILFAQGVDDLIKKIKEAIDAINKVRNIDKKNGRSGRTMTKGGTIDTDTPIVPEIIADSVARDEVDKSEKHKKLSDQEKMNLVSELSQALVDRANLHYKNNASFKKDMNRRGNIGRDKLYMWMEHWSKGYLKKGKFDDGGEVEEYKYKSMLLDITDLPKVVRDQIVFNDSYFSEDPDVLVFKAPNGDFVIEGLGSYTFRKGHEDENIVWEYFDKEFKEKFDGGGEVTQMQDAAMSGDVKPVELQDMAMQYAAHGMRIPRGGKTGEHDPHFDGLIFKNIERNNIIKILKRLDDELTGDRLYTTFFDNSFVAAKLNSGKWIIFSTMHPEVNVSGVAYENTDALIAAISENYPEVFEFTTHTGSTSFNHVDEIVSQIRDNDLKKSYDDGGLFPKPTGKIISKEDALKIASDWKGDKESALSIFVENGDYIEGDYDLYIDEVNQNINRLKENTTGQAHSRLDLLDLRRYFDYRHWEVSDKYADGGAVDDETRKALDWWNDTLSINEQNAFAKKHLRYSFQVSSVIGDYLKYTSASRYRELIHEIWEKEIKGIENHEDGGEVPDDEKDWKIYYFEEHRRLREKYLDAVKENDEKDQSWEIARKNLKDFDQAVHDLQVRARRHYKKEGTKIRFNGSELEILRGYADGGEIKKPEGGIPSKDVVIKNIKEFGTNNNSHLHNFIVSRGEYKDENYKNYIQELDKKIEFYNKFLPATYTQVVKVIRTKKYFQNEHFQHNKTTKHEHGGEVGDSSVEVYGKKYDTKTFKTDKETNEFLEEHPEYGVIAEKDGLIHVAKNIQFLPDAYYKKFRLKGNGKREYSLLQSHSLSDLKQAAKQLFPKMTYDEHKKLYHEFSGKFKRVQKEYSDTIDKKWKEEFHEDYHPSKYKVSGIVTDSFSPATKDKLRRQLDEMNEYRDASFVHEAMLKKADKIEKRESGGDIPPVVENPNKAIDYANKKKKELQDFKELNKKLDDKEKELRKYEKKMRSKNMKSHLEGLNNVGKIKDEINRLDSEERSEIRGRYFAYDGYSNTRRANGELIAVYEISVMNDEKELDRFIAKEKKDATKKKGGLITDSAIVRLTKPIKTDTKSLIKKLKSGVNNKNLL